MGAVTLLNSPSGADGAEPLVISPLDVGRAEVAVVAAVTGIFCIMNGVDADWDTGVLSQRNFLC